MSDEQPDHFFLCVDVFLGGIYLYLFLTCYKSEQPVDPLMDRHAQDDNQERRQGLACFQGPVQVLGQHGQRCFVT